jgi:hypothetical protein
MKPGIYILTAALALMLCTIFTWMQESTAEGMMAGEVSTQDRIVPLNTSHPFKSDAQQEQRNGQVLIQKTYSKSR